MDKLKELLKAMLGDQADEAKIDEVVGQIISQVVTPTIDAEVEGLKGKNDELLRKLKAAKGREPDEDLAEKLQRLKEYEEADRKAQDDADKKAQNFDAILNREREKMQKQVDELQTRLDAVTKQRNEHLLNTELLQGLTQAGVADHFRDVLSAALTPRAAVKEQEDGSLVVLFKDSEGIELPAGEYFKDWAQSEGAKHYIADKASGGGAPPGSRGGTNDNTMTRADFEKLPPSGKQEFVRNKGVVTD